MHSGLVQACPSLLTCLGRPARPLTSHQGRTSLGLFWPGRSWLARHCGQSSGVRGRRCRFSRRLFFPSSSHFRSRFPSRCHCPARRTASTSTTSSRGVGVSANRGHPGYHAAQSAALYLFRPLCLHLVLTETLRGSPLSIIPLICGKHRIFGVVSFLLATPLYLFWSSEDHFHNAPTFQLSMVSSHDTLRITHRS